jgi:hypothetical protein
VILPAKPWMSIGGAMVRVPLAQTATALVPSIVTHPQTALNVTRTRTTIVGCSLAILVETSVSSVRGHVSDEAAQAFDQAPGAASLPATCRVSSNAEHVMSSDAIFSLRRSPLNPFLFSEVGIEANGATLSVISMFARRNEDPWAEAAGLAAMPFQIAVECLARTIAALPATHWPLPDATVIAHRLVALLPSHSKAAGTSPPERARVILKPWTVVAIGLMVMLGVLAFLTSV